MFLLLLLLLLPPLLLLLLLLGVANKARLKKVEDQILDLLSGGHQLLEDEGVIQQLDTSKRLADDIEKKQADIEDSQRVCDKTMAKFLPVAQRASGLFFCVTELAHVDPMYQFSLGWFLELFAQGLRGSTPNAENRDQRIAAINDYFTASLYNTVCLSLFEKDKLLFAFLLAVQVSECSLGSGIPPPSLVPQSSFSTGNK